MRVYDDREIEFSLIVRDRDRSELLRRRFDMTNTNACSVSVNCLIDLVAEEKLIMLAFVCSSFNISKRLYD